MRAWKDMEMSEIIYEEDNELEEEEEEEKDGSNSLSLTPSIATTPTPPLSSSSSPSATSLESIVEAWSKATGRKTDVTIRIHDQSFQLHKHLLASRSAYLKRKLTPSSTVTVTPPSNITATAFAAGARFCYGADLALTPSSLPSVWIAAEWMEIPALVQETEGYFRREIAGDPDRAAAAIGPCLGILPAAAALAARCVEVLATAEYGSAWADDVTALPVAEFRAVAEAMADWFAHDHDVLYRIVDRYLEVVLTHTRVHIHSLTWQYRPFTFCHKHKEEVKEEERTRICFAVNCSKLSHQQLIHLVQNPRMPLRFVIQAMLFEQMHTRHSILEFPAAVKAAGSGGGGVTLGAILQQDAARRQATQLRAAMEATSMRIESLERDLEGMRRRLRWSEEKRVEVEDARSESFREGGAATAARVSGGTGRGLGRKLVIGLKSMFRASPAGRAVANGGLRDLVVEEEDRGKNRSVT